MYDVVIVGGGPAGLSAGIYCARARLKTVLLEGANLGGQVTTTDKIENYPGFIEISGMELIGNMEKQARRSGLEIKTFTKVHKLTLEGPNRKVCAGDDIYPCKTIILAGGQKRSGLNLAGEDGFIGKGVSYCAVCDANFFKEKRVAVVGGGDTAIEDANYLSKFASKVFVIHRRSELRATKILQESAFCNNKISILWNHTVEEIIGNNHLESMIIKDVKTGENTKLEVDGLFVAIGSHPHTDIFKNIFAMDEQGYIKVDDKMRTSIPGIFAAGDIRLTPLRQIATAVGDGAIAAISAERYINETASIC
ncbi:MAG: thioredoxin-disulfide reductase [Deltaproteobacteria bacterium]|nr:thioredoxin-disulfide reductase [Deltaproteobacteria bacterium]